MTPGASDRRGELNATKVVEAAHEALDGFGKIATGKVLGTEVLVFEAISEHVTGGAEHGGGDREDGFLSTALGLQRQELGQKVGALQVHCRPGGSNESGLQPRDA